MTWLNPVYNDRGSGYNGLFRSVIYDVYPIGKRNEKSSIAEPTAQANLSSEAASKRKTKSKRVANCSEKGNLTPARKRKNDSKHLSEANCQENGEKNEGKKGKMSAIKRMRKEEKISLLDEDFTNSDSD